MKASLEVDRGYQVWRVRRLTEGDALALWIISALLCEKLGGFYA